MATQEEAEALMRTDPAIIAGRFTMEVLPWYGPAGLTYDGHVRYAMTELERQDRIVRRFVVTTGILVVTLPWVVAMYAAAGTRARQ